MPDFCVPDDRDLRFPSTGSNFGTLVKLQRYPQNIPYIPVVEIFAFLELEHKLPFFKGLGSVWEGLWFHDTGSFIFMVGRLKFRQEKRAYDFS